MPRRKQEEIDYALWLRSLKPWMRHVVKILAGATRPLSTSEILDLLAERLEGEELEELAQGARAQNKLLHFLKRLHQHGILRKLRIGYYRRYAWILTDEARKRILQALQEAYP